MRQRVLFLVSHKVGSLQKILGSFQKHHINLENISSRPSRDGKSFEIIVDIEPQEEMTLQKLKEETQDSCERFDVIGTKKIPWFPRKINDLDKFSQKILEAGGELTSDHPGFNDKLYRERRNHISEIALAYKQ